MLCWFLPYKNVNQSEFYVYIRSLLSLPLPSHPIPLGCHRAQGWDSQLNNCILIIIYFTHDRVKYVNVTFSIHPNIFVECVNGQSNE